MFDKGTQTKHYNVTQRNGHCFKSLVEAIIMGFLVWTKFKDVRNCFPFLASYCSGLPAGKYLRPLCHVLFFTRPFTLCTNTVEDMTVATCGYMRNIYDTLIAQTAVNKLPKNDFLLTLPRDQEQRISMLQKASCILSDIYLSQWASFFEFVSTFARVIS